MTIREELRACAATRRVDVEKLGNTAFLIVHHVHSELLESCIKAPLEHRSTFLLLVAEAL